MITKGHLFHLTFVASLFLATFWGPLARAEDWQARLEAPSSDAASLWADALQGSESDAFVKAMGGLSGESLQVHGSFIHRISPGGDLAVGLSEDQQALVMGLLPKSSVSAKGAAYRLWRIHQLTPSEALKSAALAALKTIDPEALPAGVTLAKKPAGGGPVDPEKLARGKDVYMTPTICFTCHQPNGQGIPGAFPPLAGSEWLDGDTDRLIKIVLKGLMGEIEVKGSSYNSAMLPLEGLLSDEEIADVLSYVRNEWGAKDTADVSVDKVKEVRAAVKDKAAFYQVTEILKEHPLIAE